MYFPESKSGEDAPMKLDATQNLFNGSTPVRLHGLPPAVTNQTQMLVLGSFPGATSLARQQYYAHPQNAFWKILQAIWPSSPYELSADSYEKRINWLLDKGIGLWDVYASCEREGSLDSAIHLPQVNDLTELLHCCPNLRLIAHNGGESFRHAKFTRALALPVYRLPSSSPANASWSFERKLAAWREVMEVAGLL
jgi:hypoxanthine-DNA glycosylase